MLQQIKLCQEQPVSVHSLQTQKQHNLSTTPSSLLFPKQCIKFSRRELTLFANSSLLLLLTSQTLDHPNLAFRARADEIPQLIEAETQENSLEIEGQTGQVEAEIPEKTEANNDQVGAETKEIPQENEAESTQPETEAKTESISENNVKIPDKRAFLEISINGKPAGRIIIKLNEENAPIGANRFSDLVSGKAGITFRRKEFTKIMPTYVQHGGVRSYGVDAELASKTGGSLTNERLIEEWEKLFESQGTKNVAGTVSLIIRDPLKPPPKIKLVAKQGKLVVDEEEVGVEPNGTEFTISMRDSPELDSSALVIGNVIQGMDVVEKIGEVKTVQDNTTSPYFRVAKLIGDKRAVVAERGFNRPYSKVIITNCGFLE